MTARIIDGKAFAAKVRGQVAGQVTRLSEDHGLTPGLAVVLVGEDPASEVFADDRYPRIRAAVRESYSQASTRRNVTARLDRLKALYDEIIADKMDFLTKGRASNNEGAPDIDED